MYQEMYSFNVYNSILYDDLLLGKPSYNMYIDDKSFHIDSIFPVPNNEINKNQKSKKLNSNSKAKSCSFLLLNFYFLLRVQFPRNQIQTTHSYNCIAHHTTFN